MQVTGIVCEYNPFHLGHKKQIDFLKRQGHTVVCLMSGNFVQRGHPAIYDMMTRAKAALHCGADLVLELPIGYAISSAEGFADGSVRILSRLCDNICFGAETADAQALMETAKMLHAPLFTEKLRRHLDSGLSFPAARSAALTDCGLDGQILASANNILAVEYCKAILSQQSKLQPMVIHRQGSYHDTLPDRENPSATSLRALLDAGEPWHDYVPADAANFFEEAPVHTIKQAEQAILYRLRTMTDTEFEALPYGSEGLWRKLMHASRSCCDLESIIAATKSKRYTRTRIDRMILCAFLGLSQQDQTTGAPYCRILAFNDSGRQVLASIKEDGFFVNIGQHTGCEYENLEQRSTALYGLFAQKPDAPDMHSRYRVYYLK